MDVVVKQHAAKQSRRVAWGKARGDGGRRPSMSSWSLRLQQVLPQDLHQVFIQAGVFGHGGHCQGVLVGHPHACLLGHACPGFTATTTSTSQVNEWQRQPRYVRINAIHTLNVCFFPLQVQGFPQNLAIFEKKHTSKNLLVNKLHKKDWVVIPHTSSSLCTKSENTKNKNPCSFSPFPSFKEPADEQAH